MALFTQRALPFRPSFIVQIPVSFSTAPGGNVQIVILVGTGSCTLAAVEREMCGVRLYSRMIVGWSRRCKQNIKSIFSTPNLFGDALSLGSTHYKDDANVFILGSYEAAVAV